MNKIPIDSITVECAGCLVRLDVPLTAKCYTCPECGEHVEFDARANFEALKRLMSKAYGEKPPNPDNN